MQRLRNKILKIHNHENNPKTKNLNSELEKKEIQRYKCNPIKLIHEKGKEIEEINTEYERLINCSITKYKKNENKVLIEGVTINNVGKHILEKNTGAIIIIKNADFNCKTSIIKGRTTINSDAQILRITGEGQHTITNSKFQIGETNRIRYNQNNVHLLEDPDPSLIIFEDSLDNSITNIEFFTPKK